MNTHEFTPFIPTSSVCKLCYKMRSHENHEVRPPGIHVVEAPEPPIDKSNLVPDIAVFNEPEISNFEVFKPLTDDSDPGPIPDDYLADEGAVAPMELSIAEPEQSTEDEPAKKMFRVDQAAVELNRSFNMQDIQREGHYLTAAESVASRLEHESFVVNNIIHKPDGSENPNWAIDLELHIADIRKKIEKFRTHEQAAFKVRTEKQTKDLTKLTPEEIEQYQRDLKKKRQPKKAADETVSAVDTEKQIKALLKKREENIKGLVAIGISRESAEKTCAKLDAEVAELRAKLKDAVASTGAAPESKPTEAATKERMSKRERAIESLVNAGVDRKVAEGMVP